MRHREADGQDHEAEQPREPETPVGPRIKPAYEPLPARPNVDQADEVLPTFPFELLDLRVRVHHLGYTLACHLGLR